MLCIGKPDRLVTDNLNTHLPAYLYERFVPSVARKLVWHYRPEHGNWLNIAGSELSVLHRQCINRRLPDLPGLTLGYLELAYTVEDAGRVIIKIHPWISHCGQSKGVFL